jgi:hypothetical protein
MRGLDSKVLVRRLEEAPSSRPGYAANLSMMHRLMKKGTCNAGEGMRLKSLQNEYSDEYRESNAERQGQQGLL